MTLTSDLPSFAPTRHSDMRALEDGLAARPADAPAGARAGGARS